MTEEEWKRATDPAAMLAFLQESDKLSERKARLFAVACCRRIWHQLNDPRTRVVVEVAERFADGDATSGELAMAGDAAWACCRSGKELLDAAEAAAQEVAWMMAADGQLSNPAVSWALNDERREQATILRDLCDPFQAVSSVFAWRTQPIVTLARHIYDDRIFDAMPVLGAALSDAGCTDPRILHHCGMGSHVRGCFLVDMLLGKE